MNANSKILKIYRGKIPIKRNSVGCNHLNLTIPRRHGFSGHFHLNTTPFTSGLLKILVRN